MKERFMQTRTVALLAFLAFAGGAAGFAWISTSVTLPWESTPQIAAPDADPALPAFAMPAYPQTIVQPSTSQAEALLLVANARRAVETGRPLGDLGQRLQVSFGQSQPQALATIVQLTRKPVSTAALLNGFDRIAPQLLTPSGTLWDRARHEMATLFVIRRTDAKPSGPSARLNAARAAILSGDIAGAMRIVRALPGAAIAQPWLDDAARAVKVSAAFDQLNSAGLAVPVPVPAPVAAIPESATPETVENN
jgi:hypothetical protein